MSLVDEWSGSTDRDLLPIEVAASVAGIGLVEFRRLIDEGAVEVVRVGGRRLAVRLAEIERIALARFAERKPE